MSAITFVPSFITASVPLFQVVGLVKNPFVCAEVHELPKEDGKELERKENSDKKQDRHHLRHG